MPTRPKILVVDDDPKVRTLMRRCFEQEGFGVIEAKDGDELRQRLADGNVALITLDLGLPGEDGITLARAVRSTHQSVPIIMVTGKADVIDRVVGLEVGADDYIAKPFHVRELLARVRAVLRRSEARPQAALPSPAPEDECQRVGFDGWLLDISRRELKSPAGTPVDLTTAEFNLLEVFVRNPNRVLSRDDLMDQLKGRDWTPLDRAIDSQIARLRKKIEPEGQEHHLIKTVRGVGYQFTAQVRKL